MTSPRPRHSSFDLVREIGGEFPNVVAATKYDGSPVLKVDGVFLAGMAMHPSAEPDTLIVRTESEDGAGLLADDPETYYLTPHYSRHPVVLVRLSRISREILRELLRASWRIAVSKSGRRRTHQPR